MAVMAREIVIPTERVAQPRPGPGSGGPRWPAQLDTSSLSLPRRMCPSFLSARAPHSHEGYQRPINPQVVV